MNDIFVRHLDKSTSKKLIELGRQHGYEFYGNCKNMTVEELIDISINIITRTAKYFGTFISIALSINGKLK